jgi:hypothetical protein
VTATIRTRALRALGRLHLPPGPGGRPDDGVPSDDSGMSTVEYAIGTVAAAAFAAILYTVLSGETVVAALTGLVQRALSTTF